MRYALAPLAKRWGIEKRKDVIRFTEQGLGFGLLQRALAGRHGPFPDCQEMKAMADFSPQYLCCVSPYAFNMDELFLGSPARGRWAHQGLYPAAIVVLYPGSICDQC